MSLAAWRGLAGFPAAMETLTGFPALAPLPRLRTRGCVPSPGSMKEAKVGLQAPLLCLVPRREEAEKPRTARDGPRSPHLLLPTWHCPCPGGLAAASPMS